jgi:hypothetical protein
MIGEILLGTYLIFAIVVGIKLYPKTDRWLSVLDRITPEVSTSKALKYGLLAFGGAALIELIALYFSSGATFLVLPLIVGFSEEGMKLAPYLSGGDELYRWRLTTKVALIFAIIEALLYGIALLFSGNVIGALLRLIVVTYHVSFTAIALGGALKGSLVSGYLKASLLHALYDAPVFAMISAPSLSPVIVPLGIGAVVYTYYRVDEAFGLTHRKARRALEKRKRKAEEFWNERRIVLNESEGDDFISSP